MEGGEHPGLGGGLGLCHAIFHPTAAAGYWRARMPASWRDDCHAAGAACRRGRRKAVSVTAPQPVAAQDDVIFNEPGRRAVRAALAFARAGETAGTHFSEGPFGIPKMGRLCR